MFACGDSGVRVATCFEKLAHFLSFADKIGAVTFVTFPILIVNVECSHCVPIFEKGNGKAIKSHPNDYRSAIIKSYQEAITDPLIFVFAGVTADLDPPVQIR